MCIQDEGIRMRVRPRVQTLTLSGTTNDNRVLALSGTRAITVVDGPGNSYLAIDSGFGTYLPLYGHLLVTAGGAATYYGVESWGVWLDRLYVVGPPGDVVTLILHDLDPGDFNRALTS